MPRVVDQSQFEIVQNLLQKQDEALEKLDELNQKIESAISEIVAEREDDVEEAQPTPSRNAA